MIEARDPVLAGLLGESSCRDLSPEDRAIMLEQRIQVAIDDQADGLDLAEQLHAAEERADSAENEVRELEIKVRAYEKLLEAGKQLADAVRACEDAIS